MVKRNKPRGWGTLNQRPNGTWEGVWSEHGKRMPPVYFPTEAAGLKYMDDRMERIQQGRYVPPSEWTIRQLIEQYMDRKIAYKDWAPATINLNRRMARDHILPHIGKLRIMQVDQPRLQHWIDELARTLSANTIAKCVAILSGAYNEAVGAKILTDNPCKHVRKPKHEDTEKITWSKEEVDKVDVALQDDPFWLALYRLVLLTGLRPGELRALTWSDVDFAANRIRVRRTTTISADGKLIVGKTTKTKKDRYVKMGIAAREALADWQRAQVRRSLKPDTDYVFASASGKPLFQTKWRTYQDKLCLRAGVTRLTLHQLRHTYATQCMAEGIHMKVVQETLGHRRLATTMDTYSHMTTQMQDAAADAMNARLFGKKSG